MYTSQRKLNNDPLTLIMGIISIPLCCCYSFGIVFGIIGWVTANSAMKEYESDPEAFLPSSYENVKLGKTISIVGTVINGLALLLRIILLILGIAFSDFSDMGTEF